MTSATFPRLAAALLLGAAMLAASPADAGRHDRGDDQRYGQRDWNDRDDRHWDRDDRRWDRHERRDERRWERQARRDERRWDRHEDRRDWRRDHRDHRDHRGRVVYREVYRAPTYGFRHGPPPRHYGPPRWARGYRIHDYGWAPTYVIVDYHRHGLRHPPRGHHWRRDDRGDWLLVAIATGIVVDVILNH